MTPTSRLRFVIRYEPTPTKVLQQWWAVERSGQITPEGEWRDVPLEKE